MADAITLAKRHERTIVATAAVSAGEIYQMADGRAAVYAAANAASSGDYVDFVTEGVFTVAKTTSVVITDGQPVYWDHSANSATYAPASDKDFFLGTAVDDAAAAATTLQVNLNVWPSYKIDINRGSLADSCVTALVLTAGTPSISRVGGSHRLAFSATAEAQKIDILSNQGFAVASNWIVEGGFTIVTDGDDTVTDFNIGVANATHASDADSITESCFLHTDDGSLNILAESDDGTTEVAATDTTVDFVASTPVHFVMDGRDPSDVQIYINGALVLSGTTFDISAATGPLKLLAHLEKSANDAPGEYYVDYLRVRTMEVD